VEDCGASIAYHLAEAGCANVLVLEREPTWTRSTGKSMGGVRAQFPPRSTFACRSMRSISLPASRRPRLPRRISSARLSVCGDKREALVLLRTNYQLQTACGVKTVELLAPAEVLRRMPHLRADDIVAAFQLHRRICGPVQRHDRLHAAGHGKRRASVEGVRSHGDLQDAQGIAGVDTTRGRVTTRTVVNAAGPWAAKVAALAGVELPVEPLRRMLVPTEPFPLIARDAPMTLIWPRVFISAPRVSESCSRGTIRRRHRDSKPISIRRSSRRFFCAPWTAFPA